MPPMAEDTRQCTPGNGPDVGFRYFKIQPHGKHVTPTEFFRQMAEGNTQHVQLRTCAYRKAILLLSVLPQRLQSSRLKHRPRTPPHRKCGLRQRRQEPLPCTSMATSVTSCSRWSVSKERCGHLEGANAILLRRGSVLNVSRDSL